MATGTITINEYNYNYNTATGTCSAVVNSSYTNYAYFGGLFDEICVGGAICKLTSLYQCFKGCSSLLEPPRIPQTVTNMEECFYSCTKLKYPPLIPNGVTTLKKCFYNCTSLWSGQPQAAQARFVIPNTVTAMWSAFENCSSMKYAPVLPNNSGIDFDACFRGCSSLIYCGGMPKVGYGSNTFAACGKLEYGPQVMKTDGTDLTSSAYTGGTLSSLVTPHIGSGTTGDLNIKSLLTKLMNTGVFTTSNVKTKINYFTTSVVNSIYSTIGSWTKVVGNLYRGVGTNSTSKDITFRRQTNDGFELLVLRHNNGSMTYTSAANWRRSTSASFSNVPSAGRYTEMNVWGCIGNMNRNYGTNVFSQCCTLNNGTSPKIDVASSIYAGSSTTTTTVSDLTFGMIALSGGESIDNRAICL